MKSITFILLTSSLFVLLHAKTAKSIAQELHLQPGAKASVQWERVFSSPRHMKKYKVDTLDKESIVKLKTYLINHAADSAQPIVPGL